MAKKPQLLQNSRVANDGGTIPVQHWEFLIGMLSEIGGQSFQESYNIFSHGIGAPDANLKGVLYFDKTVGSEQLYHYKNGLWVTL